MSSVTTKRSTYSKSLTEKRLLATGKKLIKSLSYGRGRPSLDKSMQSVIRNLRKEGATLQTIANVCDVCMSTAIKYSWCIPHQNRLNVNMTINRRTGMRSLRY